MPYRAEVGVTIIYFFLISSAIDWRTANIVQQQNASTILNISEWII